MNIAVLGLGKMGQAIAKRLIAGAHTVSGFDLNVQARERLEDLGGIAMDSAVAAVEAVDVVWLMLPAGEILDTVLAEIVPTLTTGAIIVDGGNSKYTDSMTRATQLAEQNIMYLDCGTSGGLAGETVGFCLMVGGDKSAYDKLDAVWQAIAAPEGYAYMGPSGTGHYVKMIHNGIEYALLQSYAEGFELLKEGEFKNLNLETISGVWRHGSIIRSYILDLTHEILEKDQNFADISGKVNESGMGRWTVELAKKESIPVPMIKEALNIRTESQKTGGSYATKLVALLRNAFGGHAVNKLEKRDE